MVKTVCLPGCGVRTMLPLFDDCPSALSALPLFLSFSSTLHTCAHIIASKMMLTPALLGMTLLLSTLERYGICNDDSRLAGLELLRHPCPNKFISFVLGKNKDGKHCFEKAGLLFFREEFIYLNFC